MSSEQRVERLIEYVEKFSKGMDKVELYNEYRHDIDSVKPGEAFSIFFSILESGQDPRQILEYLGNIINAFYNSLVTYEWKQPKQGTFLWYLMEENREMDVLLNSITATFKLSSDDQLSTLKKQFQQLQQINFHFIKKENILFPYMDKKQEKFDGLTIMWSLHDVIRQQLKYVIELIDNNADRRDVLIEAGQVFYEIRGLMQKEDLLLYPVATELFTDREFKEMLSQAIEYPFAFIKQPKLDELDLIDDIESEELDGNLIVRTSTGELNLEQIFMIFDNLPVDLSFVDEHDQVKFFNNCKERFFPRSKAVINRSVEKCHPKESVHVVKEILDAFKLGLEDEAKFWLNIRGKMIMITYYALRDKEGNYKGTLEVSQDITGIRALEGERRLLSWSK